MPIYSGNTKIKDFYYGNTKIGEAHIAVEAEGGGEVYQYFEQVYDSGADLVLYENGVEDATSGGVVYSYIDGSGTITKNANNVVIYTKPASAGSFNNTYARIDNALSGKYTKRRYVKLLCSNVQTGSLSSNLTYLILSSVNIIGFNSSFNVLTTYSSGGFTNQTITLDLSTINLNENTYWIGVGTSVRGQTSATVTMTINKIWLTNNA